MEMLWVAKPHEAPACSPAGHPQHLLAECASVKTYVTQRSQAGHTRDLINFNFEIDAQFAHSKWLWWYGTKILFPTWVTLQESRCEERFRSSPSWRIKILVGRPLSQAKRLKEFQTESQSVDWQKWQVEWVSRRYGYLEKNWWLCVRMLLRRQPISTTKQLTSSVFCSPYCNQACCARCTTEY